MNKKLKSMALEPHPTPLPLVLTLYTENNTCSEHRQKTISHQYQVKGYSLLLRKKEAQAFFILPMYEFQMLNPSAAKGSGASFFLQLQLPVQKYCPKHCRTKNTATAPLKFKEFMPGKANGGTNSYPSTQHPVHVTPKK